MMRAQIRIITNAFRIFGFFPLEESNATKKFYAFFTTALLLILFGGICAETYLWNEKSGSRILPITYALCTMHALTKRWSIFYCKNTIEQLIEYMGNPFRYTHTHTHTHTHTRASACESISARLVRSINRALTSVHLVLFILAYISPFSSLLFGQRLMFTRIMYPIWVPWRVDNLVKYALTYFLEALLVYPALAGIYVYSVFAVFSTTTFKNEMDKVEKAIKTLETRCGGGGGGDDENVKNIAAVQCDRMYFINIRECIIHYQIIRRNFKVFAKWYNIFFSVELFESTTTICLLFYCTIKMGDMSLILNLLSLCFHLIVSLLFRCYIGEYFKKMNENVTRTLYNISWYEQPKSIRKMIIIFQGHLMRPMTFQGFNHFQASYHTFAYVSRISYSYFNVLLT